MASVFGNNIKLSIFGQSHSEAIGISFDGLPCGFKIDMEKLQIFLDRRAPGRNTLTSKRSENDKPEFVSGLFDGKTCGAPIAALIYNEDVKSEDYDDIKDSPRPSHADFTAQCKFRGYRDYRGGGHFSGRLTAALCVAGGIAIQMLERNGITVKAALETVYGNSSGIDELIAEAISEGDSLGGNIVCSIEGLPCGVGEPMFDGLENRISQAVFAIPAVKGIEFGDGFHFSELRGSEARDEYIMSDGKIAFTGNHNGGILGGISTGKTVNFRVCIKPTPSIFMPSKSVSFSRGENVELKISGRHDPCIAVRAVPCIEAAAAIAVLDLMIGDINFSGRFVFND